MAPGQPPGRRRSGSAKEMLDQVTLLDRPLPPGEGRGEGLPATSDRSISSHPPGNDPTPPAVPLIAGTRKGFTVKASRYIVFSFLLSLVSFSLAAQLNDTYVVPAAGNTAGANATIW